MYCVTEKFGRRKPKQRKLETKDVHTKHRGIPSPPAAFEYDHSMTSAALLVQTPS